MKIFTNRKNSNFTRIVSVTKHAKITLLFSFFVLVSLVGFAPHANAQAVLHSVGNTTICKGESATMSITIGSGAKPYVVVYTDGTTQYTINSYNSDENSEDLITVNPASTKTYSLVSVTCCGGVPMDPVSGNVTVTVNPLPANIIVSPATRVCPNVNFTISATATNGSTFELWNAANTIKIGDLPYAANISTSTNYTIRAISISGCSSSVAYQALIENTPPTVTCPGNQNLNTNSGSCNATLPDYRSLVTAHDNCTSDGSIIIAQSPAAGTVLTGGHNSTQLVTITATDASGNLANCSFTVTVKDTELPAISGTATSGNKTSYLNQCYYTVSGNEFDPTVTTDNCGVLKRTYSINGASEVGTNSSTTMAGVQLSKGINNIVWKAYDINGNTNTWSFAIDVKDLQNPQFTNCPGNRNLNMNSGDCSATLPNYITLLSITATDNCGAGGLSLVQSPVAGTVLSGNGTTQLVTITATDASSNSANCTFTVTVVDNQLPTISCPSNISVNVDAGNTGAVVTYTAPVGLDNCAGANTVQTAGLASGATFPVGITTNTFEVTDAANNKTICGFTVTVADNEFPEITCPGNITVDATAGTCGAVVNYVTPVGTDALPGAITAQIAGLASGSTFPVGTTTNTFEVTDASNNKTSCSFTVLVNDVENPTIVGLPGNIVVGNDLNQCGALVSWIEPASADNCSGHSIAQTAGPANGSLFPVGTTTVTYTANDTSGNTHVESFTVKVNDTQKPVIAGCPGNISRTSNAGICTAIVTWTEPTATDNCPGTITWTKSHLPGSTFDSGTTTVTYTATDADGNVSDVCSFNVIVTDNQKPIISNCPANIVTGPNPVTGCTAMVSWTEPTATDNCPSGITWTKSHTPGSVFNAGTTNVTYTATDANGNISNLCSFTVTVTDNIPPTAVCKNATIYLDASGNAALTAADVNNGSSDNCTDDGNLIITLSKSSFNCSNKGSNLVTMTVKDASGNQASCQVTVTVEDQLSPVITPTAGTVSSNVNASTGYCYYVVNGSIFDPIVTDNCGTATLSYTVTGATELTGTGSLTGLHLNKGVNTISWTATDASGNTVASPLTFTKTVIDNQAPVISAKTNQLRNTDTGCGYTTVGNEFDVTVTDNCSVTSQTYIINGGTPVSSSTLAGYIFNKGTNSVVWTLSDGTNSSTRTFQVTVSDDDSPTITQVNNISQNVDPGKCTAVVTWTEPTAGDNCSLVTFGQILGPPNGSTFPVGTTAIQYKASDAAGHITYMNFSVTVADGTAPALTCAVGSGGEGSSAGNPFIRYAANGVCFYTVFGAEFDPVASDGCPGNLVVSNSFDGSASLAGKQIPAGDYEIVWTAFDGHNTSVCSTFVKINDLQLPTFGQPQGDPDGSYAYARHTDPGKCYYTVPGTEFDLKNVTDNCSIQTPTYVISKNGVDISGTNSLAGLKLDKDADHSYSIVWTLKDEAGNTVVAQPFTILVTDNQAPSFTCHGNELRTIPSNNCSYVVNGTEFDPTSLVDNCDAVQDLTLTYTLDGNPGVGTTLAGTELLGGTHPVVWTITDLNGNTTNCTFNIIVTDPVLPTISTIINQERDAPVNLCYYEAVNGEFDPTVSDNCPAVALVNNQNGTSSLDGFHFPVGITVVVWKATDASGNVTTKQYQVTVNDITPPDYSVPATASRNTSSNSCYYTVQNTEFDPQGVTDNCTESNYTILNDFNDYRSLAYVEFSVGTTNVEWSVTDNFGNVSRKTMAVTVTDNVKPVITCPGSAYTRVYDQGQNYYTVGLDEFKPVVTDNCSVTSYINDYNSTSSLNGVQLSEGLHDIIWTATDPSGNSETCTVTVNVVADLYPSITCVGDQSRNNTSGQCTYTASGTEFNATSTTAGATLTNDFNHTSSLAGASFPVGTTLVTWTASQTINGELYTNSCSFYVFITDNEAPVITPPADITLYTSSNSSCWVSHTIANPVVSENCELWYLTSNQPGSYHVGTTNVVWTAEDIHRNVSTYIQHVTVIDDDAPQISCISTCRQVDEGKSYYTVYGHELDPYSIWDCSGISSMTHNLAGAPSNTTMAGAQIPSGTNSIIWTITDNATPTHNTTTCTSIITVNENDPPSVTCRGNESRATDTGVCSYTAQGTEFNITTTSLSTTLTYSLSGAASGSGSSLTGVVFGKGTTSVVWTADDGNGNTNVCCSFNVYVYDNQNPVVSWPANITQAADEGTCMANVSLGSPTATDNCDAPENITYSRTPDWTSFPVGKTDVYWTAWDTYGHPVYYTQTITITDDISPVIACPSATYYREYNNQYVNYYTIHGAEFTPSVTENCTLTSYTNNITGNGYLNGTVLSLGSHSIIWTARDQSNNTDVCTVNVVVVESFSPKISCPGNSTHYTASNSCRYTVSGTALDAVFNPSTGSTNTSLTFELSGATTGSGSTLDNISLNKGTTTVTWTARQTIGTTEYSSSCSEQIVIIDNVPPVVDLPFNDVVTNIDPGTCAKTMTLTPPTATDNCTNPVTNITSNEPATFILGTTNVRWTVIDESGNSTVYTQKVTVKDNEGPVIEGCPTESKTAVASGSNCEAVVSWPPLIATDDCSGVRSFTSTHSPGSLFPVGTTTVTYTAVDKSDANGGTGNVSTCSFNVIVTDSDPVITCTGDKTRNTNSRTCSYQVLGNELDPVSFGDNCGIKSLTWSFYDKDAQQTVTGTNTLSGVSIPRGHGIGADGIVPITWRVTDYNDHYTECTFNLTIEDHEGPQIIVPGNAVRHVDLHQKYYTVNGDEFDYVETFDNCGIVVKKVNNLALETFGGLQLNLGENTITWYAEDDKANSSQQSFKITVIDNESPGLKTAEANTSAAADGSCNAVVNYTAPTFIDYATDPTPLTITISPDTAIPGATFPIGITQVTYMAVDPNGNTFSYPFNITVYDAVFPTITCHSGSPFARNVDAGKNYYTTQTTEFDPTYFDNCKVTVTNDFNNHSTLADAAFPIGSTDVVWTVTDEGHNQSTCTITVVVTDDQLPMISHCTTASASEFADVGNCYYTVPGAEYDPYGFSDNDALLRLTYQIGGGPEVGTDMNTSLAGVQIPVGTDLAPSTTITWRLYDLSQNESASCVTEFRVQDIEPPLILTVANQNRNTDAGQADYTVVSGDNWNPDISDNCTIKAVTYQIDGGTIVGTDASTSIVGQHFAVGTHSVIWNATDIYDNSSSGSYQVIVADNEPPVVVCNDITIELDATGNYTLDENDIAAISLGSSDANGPLTITVTPNVFDCTNVGENPIILTVTDKYGNSSTCSSAKVTVQDNTAPNALCKTATISLDVLGNATVLASNINNGSTDACGIADYQISKNNIDFSPSLVYTCSETGSNSIYLKVTDVNGNSSVCSQTLTVVDDVLPSAVCKNITVSLDATGHKTILGTDVDFGSTDNCGLTYDVSPNTFDCSNIGTNTVTLTVTDPGGHTDQCSAIVTITDNIPPTAICQNITIQLDATGNATITTAQIDNGSNDACGIKILSLDKTTFNCSNLGDNTVTLTVTDNNDNQSTCTATVTVQDLTAPSVNCIENQTVSTDIDKCFHTHSGTDWNATATDGCNSIASLTYALSGATAVASNPVNTSLNGVVFNEGITTVTWTAKDGSDNESSCSFTVTVNDTQLPNAVCKTATIQLSALGTASIVAADVNDNSTDNCGIQSVTVDKSAFTCADLGTNTVTLTVTDESGNSSTCQATVNVEDNIDPVAVCKNISVELDATGSVTVSGLDVDNGSGDNCSIDSYLVSKDNITFTPSVYYSCSEIGSGNTLYMKVTDPAGNESPVCSSVITVSDHVNPTAICKNITIDLDATGNASIVAADIDNGSNDACGIASLIASKTEFTCTDKGANTVVLTVTDNHGNVSTCNSTVTVQDVAKPTFTICPTAKSVNTDLSKCNYTVTDNLWDATASDNCGVSSLTYSANNGASPATGNTLQNTVFQKGITTVTWTATDASGNSQTCVFSVTVTDNELPVANCHAFTAVLQRNGQIMVNISDVDNGSTDNCAITSYLISKNNTDFYNSLTYDCSEIGTPTIYLKVTDAAGNTKTCSSQLTVADNQAPTLDDLTDRNEVTDPGVCKFTHTGTGWDVTDNCGTINTKSFSLSGATDNTGITDFATLSNVVFNKGTTTVTWSATDNHGNTGQTVFNVVVSDDEKPTIACTSNITQTVATSGATSATVSGIADPVYDDNCAVTKLTYALSGATTSTAQLSGINKINSGTFNVGTTTVIYVAYDEAGNSETCSFTVTIDAAEGAILASKASVITSEDLTHDDFTVTLGSAPTGNVVINVSSDDTGEGVTSVSQLTFNSGNWNTPQTVRVTGVNDDVDDDDIPYHVNLVINKGLTDNLSGYENALSTVVDGINQDNDVAGITVSPISRHTTEGLQTATFTVKLNTQPTENVSFDLLTSDATEGTVTSNKPITFTPANWNTNQTVTVTGVNDDIDDGDVPYQINISNATSDDPKYGGKFTTNVAVVNDDNDTAGFVVSAISNHTTEAGGTATFTVRLTSKPATDSQNFVVLVNMVSNNTDEGTVTSTPLTFTATNWNDNQTVTVTGIDDIVVDGNITYSIVLTVDQPGTTDLGYDPLNPNDVTVINDDNDAATLAINSVTLPEGNSGTTSFGFTVTHAGAQVVGGYSVTWYTQNYTPTEASFPSDYAGGGGTLNFTGGIGETKTISIPVNGDTKVESNERYKVVLNSVSASGKNVTIPTAGKTGTGTIQNDDNASFSIDDVSIAEGNSGSKSLVFTVTLSEDIEAPNPITIDYTTSNGTAVASEDYTLTSGTLSFTGTKGETKAISVPILGDTKVELNENFTVTLSNIQCSGLDAAILNTITILDGTGLGTITNDDAATVSINSVTHNEGNSGTTSYDFTVTLSNPSDAEVKVDYATADGTATTGDSDYTGISTTTLTYSPGETSKTVTVLVNGDNKVELHETFTVTLSNLVNNGRDITLPVATSTGTGTITNDDTATLAIDDMSVHEQDGTAIFTVTLTGEIQEAVSFNYAAANIAPTSASDYTLASGLITFPARSANGTQKTIVVTILDDLIAEPTETYNINLTGLNASGQTNVSFLMLRD